MIEYVYHNQTRHVTKKEIERKVEIEPKKNGMLLLSVDDDDDERESIEERKNEHRNNRIKS